MPKALPASITAAYKGTAESFGMWSSQPNSPTKDSLNARTSWPATFITCWGIDEQRIQMDFQKKWTLLWQITAVISEAALISSRYDTQITVEAATNWCCFQTRMLASTIPRTAEMGFERCEGGVWRVLGDFKSALSWLELVSPHQVVILPHWNMLCWNGSKCFWHADDQIQNRISNLMSGKGKRLITQITVGQTLQQFTAVHTTETEHVSLLFADNCVGSWECNAFKKDIKKRNRLGISRRRIRAKFICCQLCFWQENKRVFTFWALEYWALPCRQCGLSFDSWTFCLVWCPWCGRIRTVLSLLPGRCRNQCLMTSIDNEPRQLLHSASGYKLSEWVGPDTWLHPFSHCNFSRCAHSWLTVHELWTWGLCQSR